MSTTTAAALIRYARELRDTIRHAWQMERRYPDRARYYRARRKIALQRAVNVLQWAREELRVEKSPRSHLVEFDMASRRQRYLEAAE